MAATRSPQRIGWSDRAMQLAIEVDPDGRARLTRLAAVGASPAPEDAVGLPLVDVVVAGSGRDWSGTRYCESVAGARLRYLAHTEQREGRWHRLRVDLADPDTGLRAEVSYAILVDAGALRASVRLVNTGTEPLTVLSVSSLLAGCLSDVDSLELSFAANDWLAENRWQHRALRDALPDLNRAAHSGNVRGCFGLTNTGTWSSKRFLPMGALTDRVTGQAWAWQLEHNGGWHWQVGEHSRAGQAYLALLGPTDTEHHWQARLAPGDSFQTVPAGLAVSAAGLADVLGRLTGYRRAIRRPHGDHQRLPVIFNDYMNTLMGDPTTAKLLPLIDAAAEVGAEYFCIDSGWYADAAEGWWDTVGAWQPSTSRFPGGLAEVLDHIRAAGMVPGLWLEPEVVGVRSPIAEQLPEEAFFRRFGQRVVEHGRHHLDLRHPAAVKHLDDVLDHLVGELGVGYLKLDYNIDGGPGTEVGAVSAGAGLLAHHRAHLDWLDAVLDRYPHLVIENCASGGMRMDYAMLSRLQLQSTSDQQDFLRYPPIAAAAAAAVTPEQAAVWAYPQPEFTDDEIAFTLCTALLGRVHLSGHLDRMTAPQRRLVAGAVAAYREIRADLPESVPFWPLGLPGWTDAWLALGLRAAAASHLVVWRREGPAEVTLPLAHLRGHPVTARLRYPGGTDATLDWRPAAGALTVTLPRAPMAALIELRVSGS